MMDQERLKRRAAGRAHAQLVVDMTLEEGDRNPEFVEAFLDEMQTALTPPMTVEETIEHKRTLRELAGCALSFGQYQNVPLSDVPREYLHWMQKASEDTLNLLREYLELTKSEDEQDDDE